MKPYIITNTKQDDELSKYETMSCIKINESVSDATVREEKEYLTKVRDNQVIKNNVTILNDIITDYPNNEMRIKCFLHILKSIKNFRSIKNV